MNTLRSLPMYLRKNPDGSTTMMNTMQTLSPFGMVLSEEVSEGVTLLNVPNHLVAEHHKP